MNSLKITMIKINTWIGSVRNSANDRLIFPGWDENNDFISDFNQNDNSTITNYIPDYEEPFLRYAVDRPEYLFGIDLNNNGWIDRFEDDDLPDYPYKVDRRGYNAFLGVDAVCRSQIDVRSNRRYVIYG